MSYIHSKASQVCSASIYLVSSNCHLHPFETHRLQPYEFLLIPWHKQWSLSECI